MKTIEEKIEDEIIEFEANRDPSDYYDPGYKTGFKTGAYWMKDELTRWRDPKEEMPEKYYDVLVKIECETAGVFYLIGYTVEDNTWRLYYGDGINMESAGRTIIGWREIIEP